jgi:opacity protein-like surface antigen
LGLLHADALALFLLGGIASGTSGTTARRETERLMSRRHTVPATLIILAALVLLTPASAAAQVYQVEPNQAIGFNLGYFAVRSEDARCGGDTDCPDPDVIAANLESLAFDVDDFNSFTFGGEWLFGLTEFIEGGIGAGFYQSGVPSVYRRLTHADGGEIEQELKLRIVPLTATVRFLPLGRGSIQPYVGGGIGLFNWRYSETGEFVDVDDLIFRNSYIAKGNSVGPVILGGIRAPVADVWMVGGEIRYQHAEGDIDPEIGMLSDRIDLGGWTTSFTVHLRF